MGVIRVVVPLDGRACQWLDSLGIAYPDAIGVSRNPTPNEVLAAVEALRSCRHEILRSPSGPQIDVEVHGVDGEWCRVVMSEISGDDQPCQLSFHKGHDSVVIRVLKSCVDVCGPLILYPDAGDDPVVVA